MAFREKIPYRNHARRHAPGGSDPIETAGAANLGYFSYRNTSDQTVTSGGSGIYLAVSTLDTDTTGPDYTTSYVATPTPHVLISPVTATDSVWIIGCDVFVNVDLADGDILKAILLLTSAGGRDYGLTRDTNFWYEAVGVESPQWVMHSETWAYGVGVTAGGSSFSIDSQFSQTNTSGNTATSYGAALQADARGARIWGIRIQ